MRAFTAPVDELRCIATRSPLADGSLARCMRRRAANSPYCSAHADGGPVLAPRARRYVLQYDGPEVRFDDTREYVARSWKPGTPMEHTVVKAEARYFRTFAKAAQYVASRPFTATRFPWRYSIVGVTL
jgi:hypothetical protein